MLLHLARRPEDTNASSFVMYMRMILVLSCTKGDKADVFADKKATFLSKKRRRR